LPLASDSGAPHHRATVAGTFLYVAAWLTKSETWIARLISAAEVNLWVGTVMTVFTVALGALAYTTVPHDDAAHGPMLAHRAWGLTTFAIFTGLALVSIWHRKLARYPSLLFAFAMLVGMAALTETGLRGGQLVFEHGLGVDRPLSNKPVAPTANDAKNPISVERHHEHHHDHHHD